MNEEQGDGGLILDLTVGGHYGSKPWKAHAWDPQLGLWPELGYQYSRYDSRGHFFTAGVGPALLVAPLFLRYSPRLLLGKQGNISTGFRHGLSVSFFEVVGVEFSHAYLFSSSNESHHEVALQFTVDPLFLFLLGLAAQGGGRPLSVGGEPVIAPLARKGGWG